MDFESIADEIYDRLVTDIYNQLPERYKTNKQRNQIREAVKNASERYTNLLLYGTTDPKITFSIHCPDILKQAKDEKSDIIYKCWKNTARTIKQARENV